MESQNTKILLEKYWEGLTSVEEEQQLTDHFGGELPGKNEADKYAVLFRYKQALQEEEPDTFDLSFLDAHKDDPAVRRLPQTPAFSNWKRWAIVASVAMMLAVASVTYQWPKTQTLEAKSEEMERAYTETLAALQLVADKLNEGNSSIREISVFDKTTKQIIHEK